MLFLFGYYEVRYTSSRWSTSSKVLTVVMNAVILN